MTIATWIIAIATIAYTMGTFLLWSSTREALKQSQQASKLSEEAFKLNIIVTLIGLHRPIWGTDQAMFEADKKAYENIRKATSTSFRNLIKKEFPLEGHKILKILDERYGNDSGIRKTQI